MTKKLINYFEAIKHLKTEQLFFRIYFRFLKLPVAQKLVTKNYYPKKTSVKIPTQSSNSMTFQNEKVICHFLNDTRDFLREELPWNDKDIPKLWIYQLQYFDYIHGQDINESLSLMRTWIAKNHTGIGLEPYPISIRLINWIIFLANHQQFDAEISDSINFQFKVLLSKLEFHLLGNHLWENYRAAIFVGLFYNDVNLVRKYEKKLSRVIEEQVLDDGAHAELAPMYQSILVNGLFQLEMFYKHCGKEPTFPLHQSILKMNDYLSTVLHPDGKVVQFNDSAIDFSLPLIKLSKKESVLCKDSGHARLIKDEVVLIADTGPVAISYFSGHSHSDNLTFELSHQGKRLIVDPGISTYEICEQRFMERSTAFHNTLKVSDLEQSETWMSFRLGRRAKSKIPMLKSSAEFDTLSGDYSYVAKGVNITHQRVWDLTRGNLKISDRVSCSRESNCSLSLNFHPDASLKLVDENTIVVSRNSKTVATITSSEKVSIEKSFYSPNFGQKIDCQRLVLHFKTVGQREIITNIYFSA